ncbi:MAG: hypothetical protein AAGE43_18715, partial [Pseudomonadota bacterium]
MDKPWLSLDHWPQTVRSNAKKSMLAMWGFALFWNAVSWPSTLVLPQELAKENYPALLVLLFPVVGLLLLGWAVRITREWRRFGVTELTLDPYPGSIGGHVGGVLRVRHVDVDCEFRVTLECVRSHIVRSGSKRRREKTVKWQANGIADARMGADGAEVRFRFDVPDGLPESDDPEQSDYHFWQLRISSQQPGIDLNREFEIGVFRTGALSEALQVDTTAKAAQAADRLIGSAMLDPEHRLLLTREHGLEVEERNGWLRLHLKTGRQRGMALMAFVIGAFFLGVPFIVPVDSFTTGVIRVAFATFGIGLVALGLYLPFNALDVRITMPNQRRTR